METNKYMLELQFFAEDEVNNDTEVDVDKTSQETDQSTTQEPTQEPEAPILTFDELMSDKYYQSEFDKRMNKGLTTAAQKYEKELKEYREYKEKYETVNSEYEQLKTTAEKRTEELQANNEIELEMIKLGAKDTVAVKAHLNEITNNKELTPSERVTMAKQKLAEMTKENDYLFGGGQATGFELGKGSKTDLETKREEIEESMGL